MRRVFFMRVEFHEAVWAMPDKDFEEVLQVELDVSRNDIERLVRAERNRSKK